MNKKVKIRSREAEGLSKSDIKKLTIESKTMHIDELVELYSQFLNHTHQNRMTIMQNTVRRMSAEIGYEWLLPITFELIDEITEKTELDTLIKLFICSYLNKPDKNIAHQILLDSSYHSIVKGRSIYALLTSILASFPLNDQSVCDGIISELLAEDEILEDDKAAQDITNAICIMICADSYRIVKNNIDLILDFYERLLSYNQLDCAETLAKITAEQVNDRAKFANQCESRFRSHTNENFNKEVISKQVQPFNISFGRVLIRCESERTAFLVSIPRLLFNEIHVELLVAFEDTIQAAAGIEADEFGVLGFSHGYKKVRSIARKARKDLKEKERRQATDEKYSDLF